MLDLIIRGGEVVSGGHVAKLDIAVGSDADIVVIDPTVRRKLMLEDLHADTDYSIWEGWELEG